MKRFLEELLSYPGVPSGWRILDWDGTPPPFLAINYRWQNSTLRLFCALTTLGTPLWTRTVVDRSAVEAL